MTPQEVSQQRAQILTDAVRAIVPKKDEGKVECPRCHRRVKPQRFTVYPTRHKEALGGSWCPGF